MDKETKVGITKEQLLEKMKDKGTVVLNVSARIYYEQLRIKGSENQPITGVRPEDFVRAVEEKYGRDKFFITYCTGSPCHHLQDAAQVLAQQGLKAENYAGGIQEWAEAGLPLEGMRAKA